MRTIALTFFVLLFSVNSTAGWQKPTEPIETERKPSQTSIAPSVTLRGGWTYIEGEKLSIKDKKTIRDLLAGQIIDFANPYCVRDEILRNEIFQANIAVGNYVTSIEAESIQEQSRGKGVLFGVKFVQAFTGPQPMAFCQMK